MSKLRLLYVLAFLGGAVLARADQKVTICHHPPGNAGTPQTISVSRAALPAHLAHGDQLGACSTGCLKSPSVCDDGNACTTDSCQSDGSCLHTPVSCDDNNSCTADSCDPASGCLHAAVTCDDNNICTNDSCDPASGCVLKPATPPVNLCAEEGVCAGRSIPEFCVLGIGWICDYSQVPNIEIDSNGQLVRVETLCDGLDNNCSGVADLDGFPDLGLPCTDASGASGVFVCSPDHRSLACEKR